MSDRIPCLVPFCGRTMRRTPDSGPDTEFICAKHWPAIDRRVRRLHCKIRRKRKRGAQGLEAAAQRMWDRCRRQAIERAGGIG